MLSPDINIGILAPFDEDREVLRTKLDNLGVANVSLEVEQYCRTAGDRTTVRFVESHPDIVIVDLEEQESGLETLRVLNQAMPDCWLFVTAAVKDSELIIEAMRAGAREFLPKPISPMSLAQAVDRFLEERKRAGQSHSAGKIYCVTAAKGGAGATTVTINLAMSLSKLEESRVALLDLNSPVGDAAAYLNLTPDYTISDAFAAAARLDSVLLENFMAKADGFDLLAGPREFWPEATPGVDGESGVDALSRLLQVVSHTYSHTVIDMTTYLDKRWFETVIGSVSDCLMVMTPELPALWRTKRLMSFLSANAPDTSSHLILNRSRKSDEITATEIEQALKQPVYWKLPNNYNASIEAINTGSPIVAQNHSSLASSFEELAWRLTGTESQRKARRFFGLFSKNSNGDHS